MDKKQLAILITSGIVIFLIGGISGIFLAGTVGPQKAKIETANNLSSKVVSSMVAYGQVKSISGKNITLSNLGDTLAIPIAGNAQLYSFSTVSSTGVPVQQTIKFEEIKIGDKVNIAVKLLPDGKIQGTSVIVLPIAK
jgi:hypothetical protein